ncbi:MAG: hypothetical protein EWM48_06675 [Sphaerochaeta sp.]|nr:MAG: hypothetical protein EWM48_06675 [Sphaerochaeta sp.]
MNRLRISLIIGALSVLLLSSCVSGLSITRQVPAEANLHGIQMLRVEPVKEFFFSWRPVPAWVEGSSGQMELTLPSGYYSTLSEDVSYAATRTLERAIESTDHLSVTSSRAAEAVIKSEITFMDLSERIIERSESEGSEEKSYFLVQSAAVALSIKVMEVSTGSILYTSNYADKVTKEYLVGTRMFDPTSNTYKIIRRFTFTRSPSFLPLFEEILRSFERTIARQLAPSTVTEWVNLAPNRPKDAMAKEIYYLVDRGEYRLAYHRFLGLYEDTGDWRWGYNAALLLQGIGELENAVVLMDEVYSGYPSNLVFQALSRMRDALRDQQKAEMQICGECLEEFTLVTQMYTEGR